MRPLRIFYAADRTPNPAFRSDLWRENLYGALIACGHEVVEFDYDLQESFRNLDPQDPRQAAFIAANRPQVTAALLEQVRAAHARRPLDVFFSYLTDACLTPEAVDQIKALGLLTLNWYCNGSYQLRLVEQIAPHYHYCLVPERFRLADYRALGARPLYCQEAASPRVYRPYDVPQEFDVTFVGQAYGERPGHIAALAAAGIDVRVWGWGWEYWTQSAWAKRQPTRAARARHFARRLMTVEGWKAAGRRATNPLSLLRERAGVRVFSASDSLRTRDCEEKADPHPNPLPQKGEGPRAVLPDRLVGGVLSDADLVRLYSRSKINLGFSVCGDTHRDSQPVLQVRLRDFEVPMSGGFYLVQHLPELEEFYDIGKEIACYHDRADLIDKIRYYLRHDSEREAIRQAGRRRCLRDHTWQRRFEDVFAQVGLRARRAA